MNRRRRHRNEVISPADNVNSTSRQASEDAQQHGDSRQEKFA